MSETKRKFDLPVFRERIKPRLVMFVDNTDMRNAHDGLRQLAMDLKVDPDKLKPGQFLVFMNSARTVIKAFASGDRAIAHYKCRHGEKFDLALIALLPRHFSGGAFNIKEAREELIRRKVSEKMNLDQFESKK